MEQYVFSGRVMKIKQKLIKRSLVPIYSIYGWRWQKRGKYKRKLIFPTYTKL